MEIVLAGIAVGLLLFGQYFGSRIRMRAHVMIPFNDPVSLILIAVPVVMPFLLVSMDSAYIDMVMDVRYWLLVVTFLIGYSKGYLSESADVVYVGVHDILNRTQEVYPIVRYYSPEGRPCWQPQKMSAVFRSMFLGIHNPIDLRAMNNPRHVSIRRVLMHLEADAYDMAAMETTEFTVRKFHHDFKVEGRKYTPSPHCNDSPYDWIVNAQGYEQLFLEYSKAQTEAIEKQVNLDVAALKGARLVMEAAGSKTPSREFMEELGIDLAAELNRGVKRMKSEMRKRDAVEGEDADGN